MNQNNMLLIVNPVSGRQHIQSKLFDITKVFNNAGYTVSTRITEYRGHGRKLAAGAYAHNIGTIVCCGGDGTLNEVLSGLVESDHAGDIALGYIPCGSTNDFADTLGLNTDALEQAKRIVSEQIRRLDVGDFNGERYFSYIATFGAFSDASYSTPQELKNTMGHFAYILEGLSDIKNIKQRHATVIADGVKHEGDYIFASVSNTKSVGGLINLDPSLVALDDGMFEVLLVDYPKRPTELIEIIYGAIHSDFRSDNFDFFRAKDIEFILEKPTDWSLDGEKCEAGTNVKITNLNKAVQLLV